MTIDDPLGAALEQIEAQERERHPLTGVVWALGTEIASEIPIAGKALKILSKHRRENLALFIRIIREELSRLEDRTSRLEDVQQNFQADFTALLIDAMKKVENMRSKERIARLARIVANAARDGRIDPDVSEELMRVSMDLGEVDILILVALCRQQPSEDSPLVGPSHLDIDGVDLDDRQSVLLKLQSYGLVAFVAEATIGVSFSKDGGTEHPFRVLPKGRRFISDAIASSSAKS